MEVHLLKWFHIKKFVNPIRDDGPEDHINKKIGTPTMGGLVILIGIINISFMWADIKNIYILFTLYICFSFGLLGAFDDYKKIKNNNSTQEFHLNLNY